MKISTKTVSKSLPLSLKAYRPAKTDVDQFSGALGAYLTHIDSKESEENLKTHLMGLLKPMYEPSNVIEQFGDIDFVIRSGGTGTSAAVLFEV